MLGASLRFDIRDDIRDNDRLSFSFPALMDILPAVESDRVTVVDFLDAFRKPANPGSITLELDRCRESDFFFPAFAGGFPLLPP